MSLTVTIADEHKIYSSSSAEINQIFNLESVRISANNDISVKLDSVVYQGVKVSLYVDELEFEYQDFDEQYLQLEIYEEGDIELMCRIIKANYCPISGKRYFAVLNIDIDESIVEVIITANRDISDGFPSTVVINKSCDGLNDILFAIDEITNNIPLYEERLDSVKLESGIALYGKLYPTSNLFGSSYVGIRIHIGDLISTGFFPIDTIKNFMSEYLKTGEFYRVTMIKRENVKRAIN